MPAFTFPQVTWQNPRNKVFSLRPFTTTMYPYPLPHTISNPFGEELTFHALENEDGEQRMIVTNRVAPGAGPPFHVHYKQEECIVVSKGKLGYQLLGEPEKFLSEGEQIVFNRGEIHRFWNAGADTLECTGWVKPANTIDYYLTGVYNSMKKAGKPEGDRFDTAFLLVHYRSEYELAIIPAFVKKVVMPATVWVGKLLGKYSHFKDVPRAVK